ncbi:MAG: hypothetical protein ACRC28_10985, partial [Clostridium sp.]|uniref:hypothetical protein n=1 Tax=Clostridium sp. TaxID=1506 RepID=UPI003F314FFC
PFELLYGRPPNPLDFDNERTVIPEENQLIFERLEKARKIFQTLEREIREKEVRLNKAPISTFEVGDIVLRRKQSLKIKNKLDDSWEGPYTICAIGRLGNYKIKNIFGEIFSVNVKDLKFAELFEDEWPKIKEGGMSGDRNLPILLLRESSD